MNMVALIPARAGSKRLPGKNTRLLQGHPVIAYTIAAAQQSGVFSKVWCSTESQTIGFVASQYGADFMLRSAAYATDSSPDIEWVAQFLRAMGPSDRPDAFAILRPTSPFRTAETIRRAFAQFEALGQSCDSIRAVEPVRQTPWKMWYAEPGRPMIPFAYREDPDGIPYHSRPTQVLPPVYIQNSSLEMAWTRNVEAHGSISGTYVYPFFTTELEGFSLDHPGDFDRAAALLATHGPGILPSLDVAPLSAVSGPQ